MPNLGEILNQVPVLAQATTAQRQQVLDRVYEKLKASGQITPEKLRQFRQDQANTFFEDDFGDKEDAAFEEKQPTIDPAKGSSSLLGADISQYLPKDRKTYAELAKRNTLEDLRDLGKIASDPKQYAASIAKTAYDLGSFLNTNLLQGVQRQVVQALPLVSPDQQKELLTKATALGSFDKLPLGKKLNEWYEEVIKDDPSLAKQYHAAVIDSVLGAFFGMARAGKVAKAAEAAGQNISGLSKIREFFAPVVSNVTGGQLIYKGTEALDESLAKTDLSDEVKTGIRLGALLVGGLASGIGPERFIEDAIAGKPEAVKAASNLGKVAADADAKGLSFQEDLASNPDIDAETRAILGLPDQIDPTTSQNLNATALVDSANDIEGAATKLATGQEFTIEEANAARNIGVTSAEGLPDEFIIEELGPLSESRKYLPVPVERRGVSSETLARYDEEELARIDREAAEAAEAPETANLERYYGIEPEDMSVIRLGTDEPTPKVRSKALRKYKPSSPRTKLRTSEEEEISWDSIPLSRQAIDNLDSLTQEARNNAAALKAAQAAGDSTKVAELTQRADAIKARVTDAQNLITLEMGGSDKLIKLVDKELADIEKQLQDMRDEFRKTELETRKQELIDTAAKLKQQRQIAQDRRIVFQRIPRRASYDLIKQLREARDRAVWSREAEPSAPFTEKVSREDALTRLNNLPESERFRALKVIQATQQGTRGILGRSLSEEENLDIVAEVLNNEKVWSDNPFQHTKKLIVRTPEKTALVMAGYVADKYPLAGRVLQVLHPEVRNSGTYSPDHVLQLAQAMVARSGFGMDAQGWALQKETLQQTFDLWDEVKKNLPRRRGSNLKDILSAAMPDSKPGTVDKVARTIRNAFPELDLSFTREALPNGIAATADALQKLVTVGLDKVELSTLMHELGHLNFWHGMDSSQRMNWMEGMRTHTATEGTWGAAFPEYAERLAQLNGLDDAARGKAQFWMHNPSEMYAQQFSSYALSNVLPNVETLGTFQRAWRGLKRTMGLATDNWENLSVDTKELLIKTLVAPEPAEARIIPAADIENGLKSSWLYSDKEIAEPRVYEIRQMLESTYGNRLEAIPTSETDISDVVQNVPTASFFDLPVEQRVASYSLEDLPQVAEMQALSILHDIPGANWDELRLSLQRLHQDLSGDRRADLLDAMVARMRPIVDKYGPRFGTGSESVDVLSGISYSRSELADIAETSYNRMYNQLDKASKNYIAQDNAAKNKREWRKRVDIARNVLAEQKEAGTIDRYTDADVNALADSIWNANVGNNIEGMAKQIYRDSSYTTTIEDAYDSAAKRLASLDVMVDDLTDFTKYVLASKGLSQPIDPSFTQRLSQAEAYAQFASGKRDSRFGEALAKAAIQGTYVALTGLEYDPDGSYIPFLGHVRWNPEKFFETAPLGVLLMPGAWKGLRWAGSKGTKITKPYVQKAVESLPITTRAKFANLGKTVKWAFTSTAGLPTELAQTIQSARVYGQAKKQQFYIFAETMHRHFSPEEREVIAKIYANEPGSGPLTLEMAEARPDIIAAVEMTRKLYGSIPNSFKELGLWSKNFEDLGDHYINRFYDGIGKKPTSAIFLHYNISPIRAGFLKRRGLEATINNAKVSVEGESSIDALTQLQRNSYESGIELREGLKLNAWQAQDGTILYSIPDTAFDESLRGQKLVPLYEWTGDSTGYILTDIRSKSLRARRDYTPEERKGMGEILDVAVRAAAMGEQLERDLRQGKAFLNMANSPYAVRTEDAQEIQNLIDQGWTKVDDSLDKQTGLLKYGALSGMYIHPDAKAALQMLESSSVSRFIRANAEAYPLFGALVEGHKKLLNMWKVSKTVLTPIAHMNNFVSNMLMGHLMGHNVPREMYRGLKMSNLRNMEIRAKQLSKAGKFQEANAILQGMKQDEFYKYFAEMRDAKMSDSSLWATELRTDDLLEELRKADRKQSSSEFGRIGRLLGAGYEAVSKGYKKVERFAGGWYEKGDLLFKMGAFVDARMQGMSANDAVKYAYEAYFDYGNLSPVAKMLKDSGIVPFVSYIYNAIPALGRAITQHPERVAVVGLILEAMHLASIGAVYGPDETVAKREAIDMATPEYMQSRGLGGLFRTRILNPLGSDANLQTPQGSLAKNQYVDLSRMLPGSDLWEVSGKGISDIDFNLGVPGELLFTLLNQSPIINFATTVSTGQNPQLGYTLNNGGNLDVPAVRERISDEIGNLLWTTFVPNLPFIPGTPTAKNIGEALAAKGWLGDYGDKTGLDSVGLPKSLGVAVAGSFGLKFRDVYPEVSLMRQAQGEESQFNKEKSRLRRIFKDAGYTAEYKQKELENLEQTAEVVAERQAKRAAMLERLNAARRGAQGGQTLPR